MISKFVGSTTTAARLEPVHRWQRVQWHTPSDSGSSTSYSTPPHRQAPFSASAITDPLGVGVERPLATLPPVGWEDFKDASARISAAFTGRSGSRTSEKTNRRLRRRGVRAEPDLTKRAENAKIQACSWFRMRSSGVGSSSHSSGRSRPWGRSGPSRGRTCPRGSSTDSIFAGALAPGEGELIGALGDRVLPHDVPFLVVALAITAGGLGLALWARVTLGQLERDRDPQGKP